MYMQEGAPTGELGSSSSGGGSNSRRRNSNRQGGRLHTQPGPYRM